MPAHREPHWFGEHLEDHAMRSGSCAVDVRANGRRRELVETVIRRGPLSQFEPICRVFGRKFCGIEATADSFVRHIERNR